ncbi:MAG TPA: SDR family oxidoreductase [Streptosporangiaceae bacterium]
MSEPISAPANRRTVIITGGGTGIGAATARLFAAEGADVLIVGRTLETLEKTASGMPNIRTLAADITAHGAAAAIVSTAIDLFGHVDVLVNNAGITRPAKIGEIDCDQTQQQIATNLVAPLFLTQEAVNHMPSGGVIVNVSSNPPLRGWPGNSVYGSTKVALDFLTYTWSIELGPRGIRVVGVAPGPTDTPVLLNSGLSPEQIAAKRKVDRIPLSRRAQPEEIAWWIVSVTRPEASYMTGAVLRIDGGVSVS